MNRFSATAFARTQFRDLPVFLVVGIIVISTFLFLFLYQPFGEVRHNYSVTGILRIFSYALTSGVTVFVFEHYFGVFLPQGEKKDRGLSSLVVRYGIMLWVLTLAIFLCKNYWMGFSVFTWYDYQVVVYRVLAIALVPGLLLLTISWRVTERKSMEGSVSNQANSLLIKSTDRNPEQLQLAPQSVVAISSEENYVIVHFTLAGQMQNKILRNTLTGIEAQLSLPFIRIHRSMIVNLDKVVAVSGNSQGLQLKLSGIPGVARVSRKYLSSFHDAWQARAKTP